MCARASSGDSTSAVAAVGAIAVVQCATPSIAALRACGAKRRCRRASIPSGSHHPRCRAADTHATRAPADAASTRSPLASGRLTQDRRMTVTRPSRAALANGGCGEARARARSRCAMPTFRCRAIPRCPSDDLGGCAGRRGAPTSDLRRRCGERVPGEERMPVARAARLARSIHRSTPGRRIASLVGGFARDRSDDRRGISDRACGRPTAARARPGATGPRWGRGIRGPAAGLGSPAGGWLAGWSGEVTRLGQRRISAITSPYSVSPTGVKPTRWKNSSGPPSPAS